MQTFTGAQAKKRNFTIFMQTIIQLAYPPKLVFAFSWDDCNTWEKLETMVMQSSAGGGGGATRVHYGLCNNAKYSTAVHIIQCFSMQNLGLLKFLLLVNQVSVNSNCGRQQWIRLQLFLPIILAVSTP